ncbi:DUF2490 domain-containing protein [Candidatus Dependentiae bacterium]|nr:DUF2490 domain-containing protein [Candidatus Dependentiae bacterium]
MELMKLKKTLLLLLLFINPSLLNCVNDDYISFLNIGLLKEFNRNFLMNFNGEYDKYGNSKTNYFHYETGFIYNIVPKHISTNIHHRIIKYKNPNSNYIQQRIYFDLTFSGTLEKLLISNKLGFEHRDAQQAPHIFFLKNQLKLCYELESSKDSCIKPYIADTIYYDVNKRFTHMNRLYLGFLSKHNKNLFVDFYYYLESYWKRFNINLKYTHNFGIQITFYIPEIKDKRISKIRQLPYSKR